MSKVTFDMSMSLDGFVTAANVRPEELLGDGGQRLHEWAFGGDHRDREVLERGLSTTGAVIAGRRTYDASLKWWGADGPSGPVRLPLFVVSHSVPDDTLEGGVYTFVDGIEDALARAKAAAGHKNVNIMGGVEIAQQYLRAGQVDEISIHLVPILFGNGTRLFERLGNEPIQFETIEVVATAAATHLRFRILR
jgi:dihydrofolate reductase